MSKSKPHHPYKGPAGGYGSLKSVAAITARERVDPVTAGRQLWRQNKADGFMCVSCAWGKPTHPHPAEFCENGAKATMWELTPRRTTSAFFAEHSLSELLGWSDYDLEQQGRLTEPMRYDRAQDRYVPVSWADAFAEIGRELRSLDPKSVVFYASGRASLETSYMYALMARMFGSANLPDSSNMCHESTSVGLKSVIGVPVGTCTLDDFDLTDGLVFFGQNPGSNSPRFLHPLQEIAKRGAPIIVFNPLRERGLERFTNPQSPTEMATLSETKIASQYHQVKAGGDLGAMTGLCKWLIEADDAAQAAGQRPWLDHEFIAEHTSGYEAFAAFCRATRWEAIEAASGLTRKALSQAAETYGSSKRAILVYGMGLTQHVHGVANVQMVVNLALLRGNIGRPGAGVSPVRGHSNVQGQRTVGIGEKPEHAPLDTLKAMYGFDPPREAGMNTIEVCEGLEAGRVRAFIGLGGNFVRAIPDTEVMERRWRTQRLTVQIATKLNRSHLIPGEIAYLLPCVGRTERDPETGEPQVCSMEDSFSTIHGSTGDAKPAGEHLLTEHRIVAELAAAILPGNPNVDWRAWAGDLAVVRDRIEQTYPDQFKGFNERMMQPGGFYRGNSARERKWVTKSGKADFTVPPGLSATGFEDSPEVLRLITLRSNDQFNTTVYGYSDRFRGIEGTRDVVLMNRADIARLSLEEGQEVVLAAAGAGDGVVREKAGLQVVAYDIPRGCIGAYYPECNGLIPVAHHAEQSKTPAAKSVPVIVRAA